MVSTCPDAKREGHAPLLPGAIIRHGKDRHGQQRYLCKLCRKTFTPYPEPFEPTRGHKKYQRGLKSVRGRPELYDELKQKVTLSLTRTATQGLDELAAKYGISRSEFVERIGRVLIVDLQAQ
ncbi:hypothetical protein [Leptolyngbya sp. FACHB-261]|uniref:IS1/IS1595 family N-terminal zinc-binding domain-containing protein n=1 Tax=Leptolyngbya sp. FACHB-261 TaxID=2692806 RepID=UPI0018EFC616|nr:hypothetical protein [Leptolyngbya sp. FACHB-261]